MNIFLLMCKLILWIIYPFLYYFCMYTLNVLLYCINLTYKDIFVFLLKVSKYLTKCYVSFCHHFVLVVYSSSVCHGCHQHFTHLLYNSWGHFIVYTGSFDCLYRFILLFIQVHWIIYTGSFYCLYRFILLFSVIRFLNRNKDMITL